MNMVVHQAIGPYLKVMFLRVACQQLQIDLPVFVIEENICAVVAALCYVMRVAGGYDSSYSWHGDE